MEDVYLVNRRRARLKSVELPYSWLFIGIVERELLIMFLFRADWLLSKDHIEKKPFWVCDGDQQAAARSIA